MKEPLEALNLGMQESAKSNLATSQLNALNTVSMIGKVAETDVFGVNVKKGNAVKFSIYFDQKIDPNKGEPTSYIFNSNNEMVKSISLKDRANQNGYLEFTWDTLDNQGRQVEEGTYNIRAEYNLDENTKQYHTARVGRGEVQSIIFDKGSPMLRMGDMILPLDSAIEFYNKDHGL